MLDILLAVAAVETPGLQSVRLVNLRESLVSDREEIKERRLRSLKVRVCSVTCATVGLRVEIECCADLAEMSITPEGLHGVEKPVRTCLGFVLSSR